MQLYTLGGVLRLDACPTILIEAPHSPAISAQNPSQLAPVSVLHFSQKGLIIWPRFATPVHQIAAGTTWRSRGFRRF